MTSRKSDASDDKVTIRILSNADRDIAKKFVDACNLYTIIHLSKPKASDELSSRMHCAIRCIAEQLTWAGEKLCEHDWKRLLVASLYGQRILPSTSGDGFVILDKFTRDMSGPEKHDFTEYVYEFGAVRGVVFTER